MKKLISALMIGFAICSSVSAMECTPFIDKDGFRDKKCVRDEYDRAGVWSSSQPYDADRQPRKIRVSRHGNSTIIENRSTDEWTHCRYFDSTKSTVCNSH